MQCLTAVPRTPYFNILPAIILSAPNLHRNRHRLSKLPVRKPHCPNCPCWRTENNVESHPAPATKLISLSKPPNAALHMPWECSYYSGASCQVSFVSFLLELIFQRQSLPCLSPWWICEISRTRQISASPREVTRVLRIYAVRRLPGLDPLF